MNSPFTTEVGDWRGVAWRSVAGHPVPPLSGRCRSLPVLKGLISRQESHCAAQGTEADCAAPRHATLCDATPPPQSSPETIPCRRPALLPPPPPPPRTVSGSSSSVFIAFFLLCFFLRLSSPFALFESSFDVILALKFFCFLRVAGIFLWLSVF